MDAIIDYRGKSPNKTTTGVPLITAKVVKNGRIEQPEEFIAEEDYEAWMSRGLPRAGDVVMTTEAPLGEVAQLDGRKVALAQRIITLRGKQGVLDQNFLKYLLQSQPVQEELRSRATGTTVVGIRQSELRKLNLTLPPYTSQKEIGRILRSIDDKIELNRQMSETLEGIARAIFQSWFVDFDHVRAKVEGEDPDSICRRLGLTQNMLTLLPEAFHESSIGPLPAGWAISSIGALADVVGGNTPSTKEPKYWEEGHHAWATPKDLSRLSTPVLLDTERRITDAGLAQISSGLLSPGTVLMSSRAPIGYRAINEVPVAVNQGFIAMKPIEGVSRYFLLYWAEGALQEIVSRANGSTFLEISKSSFRSIPVLRPPDEVFSAFDQLVEPLYQRLVANEREILLLTQQRDALLPELLAGRTIVPTEEPS